jgi:hypothetical protein
MRLAHAANAGLLAARSIQDDPRNRLIRWKIGTVRGCR